MDLMIANRKDFEAIKASLEKLAEDVSQRSSNPDHEILSNDEFCSRLNISKKTAQKWRDNGVIKYSQIDRCIFYRLSWVLEMLDDFSSKNVMDV